MDHDEWPSEDFDDLADLELEWLKVMEPEVYEVLVERV